VEADLTVSFGMAKLGQVLEPGATLNGQLEVAEIGIPPAALEALAGPAVLLVEESDARARLPVRKASSHKGTYGHLLVVAGSPGKTGAAALCARAALRSGAGLVTVATRPESLGAVLAHAPEVMGLPLGGEGWVPSGSRGPSIEPLGMADLPLLLGAAEGKQALVIGPGLPRGPETGQLLESLLLQLELPVLLDADALNALGARREPLLNARAPLLLTPHPGEAARLLGSSAQHVQADRVSAVRTLAAGLRGVVVLKGARSLIARADGQVYVNPTGNPGMATGGTGDVLAGLCGALLAQGLTPEDAAITGTYAHGLAGDHAAERRGQLGLIASDLIEMLGEVWLKWQR
jgi:hydroxyethylthiazole kinase-like uncharacterized protein yjeF